MQKIVQFIVFALVLSNTCRLTSAGFLDFLGDAISVVGDIFSFAKGVSNRDQAANGIPEYLQQSKLETIEAINQIGAEISASINETSKELRKALDSLSSQMELNQNVMKEQFREAITTITGRNCLSDALNPETILTEAYQNFFSIIKEKNETIRKDKIKLLGQLCANGQCLTALTEIMNLMTGETGTQCDLLQAIYNLEITSPSYYDDAPTRVMQQVTYWITLVNLGLIVNGFQLAQDVSPDFSTQTLHEKFSEPFMKMIQRSNEKIQKALDGAVPQVKYIQTGTIDILSALNSTKLPSAGWRRGIVYVKFIPQFPKTPQVASSLKSCGVGTFLHELNATEEGFYLAIDTTDENLSDSMQASWIAYL